MEFGECEAKDLATVCPNLSAQGVDLLEKLLQYDPVKRLTAAQALEHAWFSEEPVPCESSELPIQSLVDDKMKAINK